MGYDIPILNSVGLENYGQILSTVQERILGWPVLSQMRGRGGIARRCRTGKPKAPERTQYRCPAQVLCPKLHVAHLFRVHHVPAAGDVRVYQGNERIRQCRPVGRHRHRHHRLDFLGLLGALRETVQQANGSRRRRQRTAVGLTFF